MCHLLQQQSILSVIIRHAFLLLASLLGLGLVQLVHCHLIFLRLWRTPHLHLSGIHRLHQQLRYELLPLSGHRGNGGKTWFEQPLYS